jgi:GNAT superfamily N-acetyltransferase
MIREYTSPADVADLDEGAVLPVPPEVLVANRPLVHLAEFDGRERLVARCSLWRRRDAQGADTEDGLVGHFAAAVDGAGRELLEHALARLAAMGCARAIGPMDGDTWHSYRFVTDPGTEPPFIFEPSNPPEWPALFEAAGFEPLNSYFSTLVPDLHHTDERTPGRVEALRGTGVSFRTLEPERFDEELARVYALSRVAFAENFMYSPIDEGRFLDLYRPIQPHVVPELVHFAEADDRLIGFSFGTPDLLEIQRTGNARTMLIKSLAVHPDEGGKGLGAVLMDLPQRSAAQLGFERGIQAFMEKDNRSRAIAAHYAKSIREYTLFHRFLP